MTDPAAPLSSPLQDSVKGSFVSRFLPGWMQPYAQLARLDRPIGWWLLLLPCWWSAALAAIAARHFPDLSHIALFLVGAIAMRGAGSTWNDILDRDLDRQVLRTHSRPLASGRLKLREAALFLALQCLVGLAVLSNFNRFSIWLGIGSLLPVLVYPMMKRITNHPQIVLGLAFSWGALMGWAAIFGELSLAPVLLYAGAVFWTIGYDTIYALQDLEDDAIVGIGSTARAYGDHVPRFIGICYVIAVNLVGFSAFMAGAGPVAMLGVLGFALHLAWQLRKVKIEDPQLALKLFRSNRDAGLILFVGLFCEAVLRALPLL